MKREILAYRNAQPARKPPREWSVAIISFIGMEHATPFVVVLVPGPFLVIVGGLLGLVGLSESRDHRHFAILSLVLLALHAVAAIILPGLGPM